MQRVALYSRLSKGKEEGESYSAEEQRDSLREWASGKGAHIICEEFDNGWSGRFLERPGLDRIRDAAEDGKIDQVAVYVRDRLARGPLARVISDEFKKSGVEVVYLNGSFDDSPEGQLMENVLDSFSEFEVQLAKDRMRRGRLKKAKDGKVVGNGKPNYGFRFDTNKETLEVKPTEIEVVRHIVDEIASGATLRGVCRELMADSIPSPSGNARWQPTSVKKMLASDVYLSLSPEEIEPWITAEVRRKLNDNNLYGVWWYGRFSWTDVGRKPKASGGYSKTILKQDKPSEDWIAVPINPSGLDSDVVREARQRLSTNPSHPRNSSRVYQLDTRAMRCGYCGSCMRTYMVSQTKYGKRYYYYRCSQEAEWNRPACPESRSLRADKLEPLIWEAVSSLLKKPAEIEMLIDDLIAEEKNRSGRRDVDGETMTITAEIERLESKQEAHLDQEAEGLITRKQLRKKMDEIGSNKKTLEERLQTLSFYRATVENLKRSKEELRELYTPLSEDEINEFSPKEIRRFYELIRLEGELYADYTFALKIAGVYMPSVNHYQNQFTNNRTPSSHREQIRLRYYGGEWEAELVA